MVLVYPSSTSTVNGISNTQSLDQRHRTNLLFLWERRRNLPAYLFMITFRICLSPMVILTTS
jgi:hypothetical protein